MAFRAGLSFPAGDATGAPGDSLGARLAWQVPLALDIGAKIFPNVFVGAYLGLGIGAEGSDPLVEGLCSDDDEDFENDVSCSGTTFRIGLEGQYQFTPDQKTNPWIGYGIGFEGANETLKAQEQGYTEEASASGMTYATISGGLDLRTKAVGAGPYGEVAIGRFTKGSTEVDGEETASGDIQDPAWHAWISLGLRMVLFP